MNPPSRAIDDAGEPPPHRRGASKPLGTSSSSSSLHRSGSSAMSAGKVSQKNATPFLQLEELHSEDALGQFSYAPATQTTVVTTTTTTTTDFPSLRMKAPQLSLDPKIYPLSSIPTPEAVKSFSFDVDGRKTVFQEADDTIETLGKVCIFLI